MKMLSDESGQYTIFLAFFLGILFFGIAALAIDAGMIYREKRMVQTAADAAALAASAEYSANSTSITSTAQAVAQQQPGGIIASEVTATSVNGGADIVVTISHVTATTFFLKAFRSTPFTVGAMAEASTVVPPVCDYAGTAINAYGTGCLRAAYCSAEANGPILVSGSGIINVCSVSSSSTITNSWSTLESPVPAGCSGNVTQNTATISDPLAGNVPSATANGTGYSVSKCVSNYHPNNGGNTYSIGPTGSCTNNGGCTPAAPVVQTLTISGQQISAVCFSGLDLANGNTITLTPGLYIINGGTLEFDGGATVGGSGVTFYLTNGASVNFTGGVTGTFTAPTTGPYNNILFYQDSGDTNAATFNGGASGGFNGTLYFPAATALNVAGNAQITMNGILDTGGTLNVSGSACITNNYNPANIANPLLNAVKLVK